jgi:N-glycosylase/DNA lyase
MLETYNSLIGKSVSDVKETLKTYSGVGDKVADCISLYSLNNLSVVPVDTHIEDTSENPEEFFAELSGADKSGIAQLYIFADQSNAQERM